MAAAVSRTWACDSGNRRDHQGKIGYPERCGCHLPEEIAEAHLDRDIHQYFAVLTSMRSVGVMGDSRTYDYTLALRGVTTTDFMTADWARIPYEVLKKYRIGLSMRCAVSTALYMILRANLRQP